ncbi:MAG TPA: glutamate synthase large subunit [Acidimicrobiales bacterium]|nr:glutamate synthase large subunit [Acidimicrobiales bacterium]
MSINDRPAAQGLYNPAFEHDACGVSFVVDMHGRKTHDIVQKGLTALCNLEHRGAAGAEQNTGDGAGILVQMPDDFFRAVTAGELQTELPQLGAYATGMAFITAESEDEAAKTQKQIEDIIESEELTLVGWRTVPIDDSMIGESARRVEPFFGQLFVTHATATGMDLERRAFILRKRVEHELSNVYFPSLSTRTYIYKGMLTVPQLGDFFGDLQDERLTSALALVHSRFSTNTFPSWPLAHPYRYVAHNGEINTVQGNQNWMRAREALLETDLFPGDIERIFPICTPGGSDTARFDEALELLHLGGRALPHAVLMMIPEAWENHQQMPDDKRAFYQYHSSLMEPWDGPASVAFTDGTVIGAVLDRNGLRPSRFWVTDDGLVVMASEVGVLDIDQSKVVRKGRLQPGKMFLVDTSQGRIIEDEEIKAQLANEKPYADWLHEHLVHLDDLPTRDFLVPQYGNVVTPQRLFGYTVEEQKIILGPMAKTGAEPIGSMGTDTPIAVLSERSRLLFDYFQQLFAQVTNPPLDAIREELVTSLGATVGPEGNLLDPRPESCRQIRLPFPIISNDELAKILYIHEEPATPGFKAFAIDGLFEVARGGDGLRDALERIKSDVSAAISEKGANLIVLSDRHASAELAPIPSLLLTSAVHHHLIREKSRTRVGLVVEAGDAREVHHMALLIGYGAAAVNPYLAFDTIDDMIRDGQITGLSNRKAHRNYIKACGKGVLKVMSKMGVSTVASYTGAQIFEAIGLAQDLVDEYFTGTVSRIGGVGLDVLAEEVARRHKKAYPDRPTELAHRELEVGGEYQWRREGEYHLFNPETVFRLQHATRTKQYKIFKEYTSLVDDQAAKLATLRGLFTLKSADGLGRQPIPIEEVEPVSEIVKRFNTGAMSYGSISMEAHQTLAIAMNRLKARSNTGEGGEDPERLYDPERRSAIKQVASGRFGVTAEYLTNSDDIQIKMAQGAKPGEGGQLPGHKVYPWIAKTRHSTPGVGLISPPPHHDIYSIEDLAQLIHDLKNSNPSARIHVKLVAEVGVGTVAAGVSKAHADVVLISGHDGGTGASPLTSLKHAGAPWELGLAETQQTLLLNGLRDRIVVQVDGQLKTGRDVVIAALLGAEEYGFATAPLVVSGCIMMRVCHLDTCPVGIATQNPVLRERFTGSPDFVVTFFEYIAEEVREILASLGFRSLEEAIGHVEALDTAAAVEHWKAEGLDLTPLLHQPEDVYGQTLFCTKEQYHALDRALDNELIRLAKAALESGGTERVTADVEVRNVNRTVGTMLGHELTKKYRGAGLPDDSIVFNMTGSAGQSFGAFVPRGITLRLFGDANDYLGKGLSGGRIILRPPMEAPEAFVAEDNIIAGNVILYGATGGEVFIRGVVGERFCVRNSGATAVVEGVGDHACEYMTGGRVVVLGPTGRNFAAGMSGGIAYVYDPADQFPHLYNGEMVDLEPLDEEDVEFLRSVVRKHREETDSAVANRILDRWHQNVRHFVKVMPTDYRRVLEAARTAEEKGIPVDEAIMAASRG